MYFLLLGIGVGMITLLPPGPVTIALVHLASSAGRRPALRGALGIASGDLALAAPAVAIVAAGTALPDRLFTTLQFVSALALVAIGALLLVAPQLADASMENIRRPGRTMFLITALTPTVLGAWIAMLGAMPFADEPVHLLLFAGGVVLASFLWHPFLGMAAASVGGALSASARRRLSQTGGGLLAIIGFALVAHSMW